MSVVSDTPVSEAAEGIVVVVFRIKARNSWTLKTIGSSGAVYFLSIATCSPCSILLSVAISPLLPITRVGWVSVLVFFAMMTPLLIVLLRLGTILKV